MTVNFFVPGNPQGKGRPRFTNGHAYTPKKTVEYEGLIAARYWKALAESGKTLTDKARLANIRIAIEAIYPVAESDSKKTKEEKIAGIIRPKNKPDIDNVAKAVLDALNAFAYYDDSQVYRLEIMKRYGEEPGLYVLVIHETGGSE